MSEQAIDPVGRWGTDAGGQPFLELVDDGSAHGSDGCNRLLSSWTTEGDQITFAPLATTLMYCEGVDTWLSRAATASVDGDRLVVRDASGAVIGTLQRS